MVLQEMGATFAEGGRQIVVFFSDGQFVKILVGTLVLFLLMFVTWWIYRSLSERNLFNFLSKHDVFQIVKPTLKDHLLFFLRYVILFPLFSFLGFIIFSLALFILSRPETVAAQDNIFFISIVLLSTIRVSAYIAETLAEDLAKLVPISFLSVLVANQSAMKGLGITRDSIEQFMGHLPGNAKYLVFIVLLEIVLRLYSAFIGHASFAPDEQEAS